MEIRRQHPPIRYKGFWDARFATRCTSRTLGNVKLRLDVEGGEGLSDLPGDGGEFVAFMSFAVSRGFGAIHPLIALADRLHDVHGVSMGPLTTFYETEPADGEDIEKLELAWQEAEGLLTALERMVDAFESDEQLRALLARASAESLPKQVTALIPPVRRAAGGDQRVRLTYTL